MSSRDDEADQYAYKVRHFNNLCHCVRNNDPDVTIIHGGHDPEENHAVQAPVGYGRRLGQALQRNTNVAVLRIDATTFLDHTVVTQTSQIQQDAELFLQYIRTSPIVRSLDIYLLENGTDNKNQHTLHLVGLILDALCDSSCIEELYLKTCGYLPLDALTNLMQSTKSIRSMSLVLFNQPGNAWGANATRMIGTALQSNWHLQELTLDLYDELDTGEYTTMLISSFAALGHLPLLRELFLSFYTPSQHLNVYEALETFLQSTLSLHHLCLYNGKRFQNPGQMEYLIRGLRDNNSINELTWGCDGSETDAQSFIEFMRSPQADNILGLNVGFDSNHPEFEGVSYGEVISQILLAGTSPLQILRFDDHPYGLGDVFNLIHTSQAPNRLRTIKIQFLEREEWNQLFECLPKLLYIQELILPHFDRNYQASQLVEALRCNGSIRSLLFWPKSHQSRYGFNDMDQRRLHAYSQRNVVIQPVPPQSGHPAISLPDGKADDGNNAIESCAYFSPQEESAHLLPSLFYARRPCWKTYPCTVVRVLIPAQDSIGPKHGAKRAVG